VAVLDYQTFMRPLLALLQDGEQYSASELLIEAERNKQLSSGRSILRNGADWARTW